MEKFRKFDGTKVPNAVEYVIDYLRANPGATVSIGCDSKQHADTTKYVTVICLQRGLKGVHVIYTKEVVPRVRDLFSRLWGEVERSKTLADALIKPIMEYHCYNPSNMASALTVHLDLNPNAKHKSNPVYTAGIGYIRGCGYNTEAKPAAWAASYVADMLVQ